MSRPIFSTTAIFAAACCFAVMAIAGGVGRFVSFCRRVDAVVDWVFEGLLSD